MKLFITIFLFTGFLSTAFITKAQDDVYGTPSPVKHKKNNYPRKIKTGFVFIDGKYIDAPYKIKIKKNVIYINDIPVSRKIDEIIDYNKIYKTKKKPILPTGINSWDKFINYKTRKGRKLFFEYLYYYYGNFPENEAKSKMIELIGSLPFVKNIDINDNGSINIITIDDTIPFILNNPILKKSERTKQSDIEKGSKRSAKIFRKWLFNNGTLIFKNKNLFNLYNEEKTKIYLNEGIPIINDTTLNNKEKLIKLMDIGLVRKINLNDQHRFNKLLPNVDKIEINNNYKNRINNINK